MTPRHELRRLMARQNLDASDAHFRRFRRTLPPEWRDRAPERRGPPEWLWWAVCLFAVWVLWTWGFRA